MRIRKIASTAFTGAAAVLVNGYAVPPVLAQANPAQTMIPDAKFVYGSMDGADIRTGALLTCFRVTASNRLSRPPHSRSGGSPVRVGALTNATLGSPSWPCSAAGGIGLTGNLMKSAPLYEKTYNSGVIHGSVRSLSMTINGTSISCHVVVTDAAPLPVSLNVTAGELVVNPSAYQWPTSTSTSKAPLQVKSVTGCLGALSPGDRVWVYGHLWMSGTD